MMATLGPLVRRALLTLLFLPLLDWAGLGLQQGALSAAVYYATWRASAEPSPVARAPGMVIELMSTFGWRRAPSVEVGTETGSGAARLRVEAAVPCVAFLGVLPVPPTVHASASAAISGS